MSWNIIRRSPNMRGMWQTWERLPERNSLKGGKREVVAPGTVQISPQKQQLIGVKFGTVEMKPLEKAIRTVGRVDYDEKRIVTVSPKVGGWIEDLFVDFTGKFVKQGDPLLTIYSPELVSTQQEYLL